MHECIYIYIYIVGSISIFNIRISLLLGLKFINIYKQLKRTYFNQQPTCNQFWKVQSLDLYIVKKKKALIIKRNRTKLFLEGRHIHVK